MAAGPRTEQSFSVPSPAGLMPIFYSVTIPEIVQITWTKFNEASYRYIPEDVTLNMLMLEEWDVSDCAAS
jgi:hypothetical protein